MSSWEALFVEVAKGAAPEGLACPRCSAVGLDLRVETPDPDSEMGYAVLRCLRCEHWGDFSRLRVRLRVDDQQPDSGPTMSGGQGHD